MASTQRKNSSRVWVRATLVMAVVIIGLMVWLVDRPVSSPGRTPEKVDRYFKKMGVARIPRIAPPVDIVLPGINGRQVRLSDHKGKVVLLNFWTTWCPDCRDEMPPLEKLHQRFKDRPFLMLAVNLRESKTKVEQFFKTHRLSFTALLDSDGQVGRSFGIRAIPTTFIIDQSGAMIGKVIGSRKWSSAVAIALVDELINNEQPRQSLKPLPAKKKEN